jgi:hypothetical protein
VHRSCSRLHAWCTHVLTPLQMGPQISAVRSIAALSQQTASAVCVAHHPQFHCALKPKGRL